MHKDAVTRTVTSAASALEPSDEIPSPGTTTARYCSNCEIDVEPGGKGHCPVCGRFLPENVVALVHGGRRLSLPPERESRRAALRASVWADLGGTVPPIMAEVAEDFVSACVLRDQITEHLEAIGPLTQRGTRRAAMDLYLATSARIERLSVQLGTFRTEIKAASKGTVNPPPVALGQMPTSALQQGHALLSRLAAGDVLSDREMGALDVVRAAMRGEVLLKAEPTAPADDHSPFEPEADVEGDEDRIEPPAILDSIAPAQSTPDAQVDRDSEAWRIVHANEPEEIERRNAEATELMMTRVGKPAPWVR